MKDNLKGKRVVIYIRVSSKEQKDFGNSLNVQLKYIKEFCAMHEMQIAIIFEEDHSAKNFARPEFQKLKTYVKANKNNIDYLLIQKWDRFSRNVGKALLMIEHFKKLNVEVNSIENWINYKDPDHIVMLSIYLSTPEAENSKIRDRSLSGTRDALENGRYCKSIPKGYMKGKDVNGKPLIQPHPENAPLITSLFNDYATGLYSQQDILKKYKHTGLNLCRTSLSRLLDNQLYIGLVNVPAYKNKPKKVVNGLHKAIVSKETFFIAQSIKNGKRSKNKVQGKNEAFPLSGFLKCVECGQVLYGSQSNNGKSKKVTRTYYYYQCNSKYKCKRYSAAKVHKELLGTFGSIKPEEEVLDLFQQILIQEYSITKKERVNDVKAIDTKLKALNNNQLQLTEKYSLGKIKDEIYEQLMANYEVELIELQADKANLGDYQNDLDKFITFGLTLLSNLDVFYKSASVEVKIKILGSLFTEKLEFFENSFRTQPFNEVILLLCKYNKGFQKLITKKRGVHKNSSTLVLKVVVLLCNFTIMSISTVSMFKPLFYNKYKYF